MYKPFFWSSEKNRRIKQERGFGFEDIVEAIDDGGLLDELRHPKDRYKNQRVYEENHVFLKTAFPSRKATKEYLE